VLESNALGARYASLPPSDFVPAAERLRSTVGGDLVVHELGPGHAYRLTLNGAVVSEASVQYQIDHPGSYPGVIPHLVASYQHQPPFDEVVVVRWVSWGNACDTSGFSFVGIRRDRTFKVASVRACTMQEPRVTSRGHEIRLVIPPAPPGIRHGGMTPLLPGEEWRFSRGKLIKTRTLSHLLPFQRRRFERPPKRR
jgi:hypothetical protein